MVTMPQSEDPRMSSTPDETRTDESPEPAGPRPGGPLLDRPIRQVLLVGHTHHDVGYTNSPRLIDDLHAATVRRVLDLCDTNDGTGPDAFRWTFEVARPVLRFLDSAGAADVERLRRRVA